MLPFKLYYYDLETYKSCFLFTGKFEGASEKQVFEISWRRNDRDQLLSWLSYLQNAGAVMIGFNNIGFDCPIIQLLMNEPYTFTPMKAYLHAQQIFASQMDRNLHAVRLGERIIPQIDLFKINHFDNKMKTTSLKALQFAMRSRSVEDLPFKPDSDLTSEQIDQLIAYNGHDVDETEVFGGKCRHLIEMRQELLERGVLTGDVLNYSDVKIGTEYLIKKIGRSKCFIQGSKPRQTLRTEIPFKSIVLSKTKFRTEEFDAVLQWFKKQVVYVGSEQKPSLETTLAGLRFHFGLGGVHASVESRRYESSDTHSIIDVDVSGMYVAVAIANGFAPEHLGQDFVTAYRQLQKDRAQYPKGTTMNAVLKLAGNGVYGNSNNQYSPFYDPQYTFSVTANGQLQLLQLAEVLSLIPGVELIQANTDGITAFVPRAHRHFFDLWKSDWEAQTGLKLEEVEYAKMFIRDVNNYIAVTKDGKVKRKGAYWYPIEEKDYEGVWNKDFSNVASIKAVEQVMINGWPAEDVIRCITNPFDFMLRYKTPAGAKVFIGDREMLKTVRYYVSKRGEPMKKVSVPKGEIGSYKRKNGLTDDFYHKILAEIPQGAWDERIHTKNKSRYEEVSTGIEKGWLVKECNHVDSFDWSDVDFDYYVAETKKLIIGEKP